MAFLTAGGVEMPCPTEIKINNEIIWSSSTGRSSTGTMVGDVVAEKQTAEITWGILTGSQVRKIRQYMIAGFFDIEIHLDETISFTGYRGTLSKQFLGTLSDGISYYKSATVNLIEQ